jgi:hypothetical protein
MSELREEIHKNDILMDKLTKQTYFVIKIGLHTVWLRDEDEKGDDPDVKEMPFHLVNRSLMKVNKDVVKILYGLKNDQYTSSDGDGNDAA